MSVVLLLATVLGSLVITIVTKRWRVHSGLITLVIAAALSFLPEAKHIEIEPEYILGIVMPPLLFSAALSFSATTFFRNLRAILGMGIFLVLLTCAIIAWFAPTINPAMSVAGAFVLASVVAPPDTVTMVSEDNSEGIPHQAISILKGESIVNDGTSLALFAVAVSVFTNEKNFVSTNPFVFFVYSSAIGIGIGLLAGYLVVMTRRRLENATIEVVLNFVVPFAVYQIAEFAHASGVLAVITAGFVISTKTALDTRLTSQTAFRTRLIEVKLWPIVDLIIESFLFAYIGFQLYPTIQELENETGNLTQSLVFALAVTLVVILIRFLYVYALFCRWGKRESEKNKGRKFPRPALNVKECFLVSWMGMRGIVTLAAAASIPITGLAPQQTKEVVLIQFTAYTVAIVTLVFQGISLPWLVKGLNLDLSNDRVRKKQDMKIIAASVKDLDLSPEKMNEGTFDEARIRVREALVHSELTEEGARAAIERVDLQQAAWTSRKEMRSTFDKAFN